MLSYSYFNTVFVNARGKKKVETNWRKDAIRTTMEAMVKAILNPTIQVKIEPIIGPKVAPMPKLPALIAAMVDQR